MERGEIWWADLPKPVGRRPVVLISRTRAIQIRDEVTAAHVTSRIRSIPTEVPLGPEDGLPKACVVNLDVINTIPKRLLSARVGVLAPEKIGDLNAALRFSLGLD